MMNPPLEGPTDAGSSLPESWRSEVRAQLATGEMVLAWFEPDLDQRLCFERRLVVLTDRRLLTYSEPETLSTITAATNGSPASSGDAPKAPQWQTWPMSGEVSLRAQEHVGAGTLDLVTSERRLTHWKYTLGAAAAAHRFVGRFNDAKNRSTGVSTSICPSCGAVISADDGVCRSCSVALAPRAIASLYRLIAFARPRANVILLGFLLTLCGTAIGLVPLYLVMRLLDDVLVPFDSGGPANIHLAAWLLSAWAAAAVITWLLEWARTYVLAWASEWIAADLRNKTYAHLQWLSLEFFGGKRTGDLMSRIGSDTDKICNFLSVNLIAFASDVLMMVMTAAFLFSMNPMLALVSLAPFPVIVWMVNWVRSRLRRNFRLSGVAWGEMTSVLADTIPGIRVVKAFAQEDREIERFGRSNHRVVDINQRVNFVWSFFAPTVKMFTELGLLVVWCFGCWQVFQGHVKIGVLAGFAAGIGRFFTRIESLVYMVSATQKAAASAQRVYEILDRVPSVAEPVRPVHPGRLEGAVELRGVRFKYGTREVLHGIDLAIRPGEMIGLVGQSGAGKSTLINLICRFYDVAEGAILVDGIDIRSFPVTEYRHNIGIVLQDPFLFYGTIAENIAYGRPDATRDEIVSAARAARAHEFILNLPDGYDSLVGERGQSLSGGERQRISIARALLIDPRILILDEATSSVDTETEREIQVALENLIQGRTTIAIAHRLSTLRRADRLVVLERGQIAEIGNHQELLQLPGAYARLHRAQLELVQGVGV
ncbi:MAG TPA: ABC transporter transmembrane domain-containing protein [Pirellulales bacterium]|nr:ABC transporter transmembrane domain-containing protein [Pirellulales bacterium]